MQYVIPLKRKKGWRQLWNANQRAGINDGSSIIEQGSRTSKLLEVVSQSRLVGLHYSLLAGKKNNVPELYFVLLSTDSWILGG